jgi:hypothetical protein
MLEQCYVLYSNDGTYSPIISNYSGLSAYTSSFVEININSSAVTGTTFYVYDLGVITGCTPTYTALTVSSTASTDCECYFIQIPQENFDTIHVDCDDNLVAFQYPTGQTFNICSKIYPVFDTLTPIPLINKGTCVGGQCPNTLITTPVGKNECDVITLFPMDVECFVIHPSTELSNNGSATLIITGGTPPYTVSWAVGSIAPALTNIGIGNYAATVVDYYGDFTANTVCTLTAVTSVLSAMCFYVSGVSTNLQPVYITSQPLGLKNGKPYYKVTYLANTVGYVYWDGATSTWLFCEQLDCANGLFYGSTNNPGIYPIASSGGTYEWTAGTSPNNFMISSITGTCNPPVPVVTYPNLCLSYLLETPDKFTNISTFSSEEIELIYSGTTNGQPYWGSSDGVYELFWQTGYTPNRWRITGFTGSSILVTNNNPVAPPVSGWQVLGTQFITNLTVTSGPCSSAVTINVLYTANNPTCTNDGSIILQAVGGTPPYQYSINGGTTFQSSPIFSNLMMGNYNAVIIDSGVGTGQQTINLSNSVLSSIYQIQYLLNTSTGTLTITAPIMPPGVSVTFDIVHTSTLQYAPHTLTPLPSYQNTVTLSTTGPMPIFSTSLQNTNLGGACTSTYNPYIQNQELRIYKQTRTMTSGQVITGTVTNNVLFPPTGNCKFANGSYTVQITNLTTNGCTCCAAFVTLTPQQNLPVA